MGLEARPNAGAVRSAAQLVAGSLILACLALALRSIPAPLVFSDEAVAFPVGADELYHMRRIWYTVENFPETLHRDPYVAFPHGAQVVWPPLFDWAIAGVARLLADPGDQVSVERVAAWVPAVLGSVTVAVVVLVAGRFASLFGAVVAGFLLAVLPSHFLRSQVGLVDHEVATALATTLVLAAAMACVREAPRRATRHPAGLPAVLLGAALAAALWLWPGALLHVGFTGIALGVWMLAAGSRGEAIGRARVIAVSHGVAFLLTAPFYRLPEWEQYGSWSPLVQSHVQPTWFAALCLATTVLSASWRRSSFGESRRLRVAGTGALAAIAAAGALLWIPGLASSLLFAAGWFGGQREDVLVFVAEVQPLLAPLGELRFDIAAARLTNLVFVFPVVWIWLVLRSLRRPGGSDRLLLLGWAGVFFVAALAQIRFVNTFGVAFALVGGLAADELRVGFAGLRAGRLRRAAILVPGLVALGAGLAPAAGVYAARLQEVQQGRRAVGHLGLPQLLGERAARWLAAETPPTRGYLDAGLEPEYGVLCSWGIGHLVRYRAERPVVQDNFGDYVRRENFVAAQEYYAATDETQAIAILDRLRVRYVVADLLGAGTAEGYPAGTMTHRLARLLGSEATLRDRRGNPLRTIPALERHRLVFHSRVGRGPAMAGRGQLGVGVYQLVQGARVSGEAEPDAVVEARIRLVSGEGRRALHRATARADADGRYVLRVPYPTGQERGRGVSAEGLYTLESGSCRVELAVPEAAVERGLPVSAPPLSGGADCGSGGEGNPG